MSDRLNLFQSIERNVPPEYLSIIKMASQLADDKNQGAALVGGIVRDLILGRNILDVDLILEPPTHPIVQRLAEITHAKVVSHERFLTFTLHLPSNGRMDIATAREESYTQPAKLPIVRPSTPQQDLKRRDFSINSIACWLNQERFGKILDTFSGVSD